jgi:hypothetical protein
MLNTSLQSSLIIRQKGWLCWRLSFLLSDGFSSSYTIFLQFRLSMTILTSLSRQSLLRWPAFPHYQRADRISLRLSAGGGNVPTGTLVNPLFVSLAAVLPVAFTDCTFRAWWRASLSDLSHLRRRPLSVSHSLNESMGGIPLGDPTRGLWANYSRFQRFGETYFSIFNPENGDNMYLRNVDIWRRVYTTPKPRRTT